MYRLTNCITTSIISSPHIYCTIQEGFYYRRM
nr:MAG TPA: hypothetical protein [Caudoviricetes sp.]